MFAAFTVTASAVRAPCAMHSRTAQPHQSARIAAFSTGAGRRELALSTARRQGPSSRHGVAARKIEATAHRANVQATATEVDEKEAVCYLRGVRMSASKVRRVLDVIRGKSYEECLIMLEFMPYRSCEPILNALFSAASNAKNNLGMNKAKLYVSECYADGGATMKRFQPRAQGRPFAIRKRTCSLVLKMKERED